MPTMSARPAKGYSGGLCAADPARRPRSPTAEASDLKSAQCRFESDRGHPKARADGRRVLERAPSGSSGSGYRAGAMDPRPSCPPQTRSAAIDMAMPSRMSCSEVQTLVIRLPRVAARSTTRCTILDQIRAPAAMTS